MDLNLVHLEFHLKYENFTDESAKLYQALRKFDVIFKKVSGCESVRSCADCCNRFSCSYYDVFAQSLSSDPQVVRRHQKPPLPYVFKASRINDTSSCFELGLVVFGRAINHLQIFVKTILMILESLGTNCQEKESSFKKVFCRDYQNNPQKLDLTSYNYVLLSARELMEGTTDSDSFELFFASPLRIINSGALLYNFDFGSFMRSQMRRCSSLYAYYGDGELDLDYLGLSEASARIKCLNDGICFKRSILNPFYSQPGLLGGVVFERVDHVMVSLIKLGTYFNAGKGASMGYGEYVVRL